MTTTDTPLWTADALERATGGVMTTPFHATGVSIDTRTLRPGDLFVALRGENSDGHAHVAAAFERGAAGALVHHRDGLPDDVPLLIVGDTLEGLRALAAAARTRFTGKVVAVTGSVGKTTTKEMLRVILGASGRTHAAEASYNNHWGVPLTLARLPAEFDYCVVEIGMNHPGEIAPLARLAMPDVAVITSVEAAHIGHMGSLEAIAEEKAAVLQGLPQGGAAVLPGDSPMLPLLWRQAGEARVFTFGAESGDSHFSRLSLGPDGSTIDAVIAGASVHVRLGAPGRHMAMNALAALAAATLLGAGLTRGAAALAGFAPVAGRGARRPILGGQATLLDESYNASGASVRAALAVLRMLPARRRLVVLGDMRELGDHAEREHRALARAVEESADLLFACGPHMGYLFDEIDPSHRGGFAMNSEELAPLVVAAIAPGDAILVKGSLGSRMSAVVRALEVRAD